MCKLINQEYVIETKDGNYYEEEVEVYGGRISKTVLKVTQYADEAKRFSDFREANDIAYAYGFNVVSLNTYIEED